MATFRQDDFVLKLRSFPLLTKYVGTSLIERFKTDNWFENRVICYVLRGSNWAEKILQSAELDGVENSQEIFSNLKGNDPDYDEKLFDALAEVRLVGWARENGYVDIEKLQIPRTGTVPDFLINRDGDVVIAEAKHFRERDFIPDFIEDRLKGLVLQTGFLSEFGISIDPTERYKQKRGELLRERKKCEHTYRLGIRAVLTEEWLQEIERNLISEPTMESELFGGLFNVRRVETPNDVSVSMEPFSSTNATETMLDKLEGDLVKGLKQISTFMDYNTSLRTAITSAVVFLAGTGEWHWEWSDMWDELCESKDAEAWEKVEGIRRQASQLIGIPFELVVRRDLPASYVHFPWSREECKE